MKHIRLLFLFAASVLMIGLHSCKKDDKEKVVEIALSVSGGTEVSVGDTDVTKEVVIAASEAPKADVVVKLASDAAEGEASFEAAEVTLKANEKSVTGKITFAAAKFPAGTAAKPIKVTISTDAPFAKVDNPTTTFTVKGGPDDGTPRLSIKGGMDVMLEYDDIMREVVVSTSKVLDRDVVVKLTTDAAEGEATLGASELTLEAGESSVVGEITFSAAKFLPGTPAKPISVTISTEAEEVALGEATTTFTVSGKIEPADAVTLTATTNGKNFSTQDGPAVAKITFTLDKPYVEDMLVLTTYASGFDFPMGPNNMPLGVTWSQFPVVIPQGTTSLTVDITVDQRCSGYMPITITVDDPGVKVATSSVAFRFREDGQAPEKEDLLVKFECQEGNEIFMESGRSKEISFYFSTTDGIALNRLDMTPVISGLDAADYDYAGDPYFRPELDYTVWTMTLRPSAVGKTFTIGFTSDDVTFAEEGKTLRITVSEVTSDRSQVRYYVEPDLTVLDDKSMADGMTWRTLRFEIPDETAIPNGTVFTAQYTGDLTADDFMDGNGYGPLTTITVDREGSRYGRYFIINESAAGKQGTITFTATNGLQFAPGSGISVDFTK